MLELSSEITRDILSITPKETFNGLTIPQALSILREYAERKTEDPTAQPALNLVPVLSESRDYAFIVRLLQDCGEWLKFFHYSVLYRSVLYVEEITTGFNDRAFIRVPLASRALLELFFYTYATYRRIYQLHQETKNLSPNEGHRAIENDLKVRDLLLKESTAARINWDDPFGSNWEKVRDQMQKVNVKTVLEKLPSDQHDKVKRWYALLSDACHPNFGSTLFVLDHERVSPDPLRFVFTRSGSGPVHLQLAVDLVCAPLSFSCVQLVNFLTVLEGVLALYREGVTHFGAKTGHH
jgi:hypothetical protein